MAEETFSRTRITFTVTTRYPCCLGDARFEGVKWVPRERFTRTCPKCRKVWDVERTTVREDRDQAVRIDRFDWTPTFTPLAANRL